ncbi:hypothetical protein QFC20_007448 [Naganishia adeliensis]|uniref:Uncharacterized protein n=1 Tax=Naganishia adeliensis TaxID=92952 RepID=A0ACC2UZS3_9TREE|nr:hypothetical protein QFC20_007448 [Naganishia adeliensis]
MENPHEEKQVVLLERIIKNVEKCNESIAELNQCFGEIIQSNEVSVTSALFQNYSRNVVYNLEATKNLADPK